MTFTPGTPQRKLVYAWEGEVDELKAEIERLKKDNEECMRVNAELAKYLGVENLRLRAALEEVVKWADDLHYFSERGTELAPVFQQARAALLNEQK